MKLRPVYYLTFLPCILSLHACKPEKNLDELKWFLGSWKGTMQNMDVHEYWTARSEFSFSGEGYVLSGKDTVFHESTKLQFENGNIVYIADIPGNPIPVSFILTSNKNNKIVFENPKHDFPKTITYHLVSPDSLEAIVVGNENGKQRKEEFHFKKVK